MTAAAEEPNERDERLQIIVAVLIAIVVAAGALIAWRASVAQDASGDEDFDGIHALVTAENTEALNSLTAYRDYGNYLRYWYYTNLAELLDADLAKATGDQAEQLQQDLQAANIQAIANSNFFRTRYLNRDGTYNVQRQLGGMWADAQREKDLEYESKFAAADHLRVKTQYLLLALMALCIAPVFYSLVEAASGTLRYILIALGTVFAVAAIVAALWIDLTM